MRSLGPCTRSYPAPARENRPLRPLVCKRMRAMFAFYVLFVMAGIGYFAVIGLAHH
jgi:hypothetical protein